MREHLQSLDMAYSNEKNVRIQLNPELLVEMMDVGLRRPSSRRCRFKMLVK